jgi:hypothetical protein
MGADNHATTVPQNYNPDTGEVEESTPTVSDNPHGHYMWDLYAALKRGGSI